MTVLFSQREWLRLHIEAVWGEELPLIEQLPLEQKEYAVLESKRHPWRLYIAKLDSEILYIWASYTDAQERQTLRQQASRLLTQPSIDPATPNVTSEVVLAPLASPNITISTANKLARPLTENDRVLIEAFEKDSTDYYLRPDCAPPIGIVIDGQLVSIAHSSRRTQDACELGIETLPVARQKGYALAATVCWTKAIEQEGRKPIYSAFAENIPSLRLAAAAGYRVIAYGIQIE
jgi:RimJ/RimL family protein N-acetyltransferase